LVSALGYTAANICLRRLAVDCDAAWVTCVKASVAVLLVGPWLLYRTMGGRTALLPLKALAFLILLGLIGQFGGNLNLQFAFATLGLTITIPTVFGFVLVASAVLGRLVLGERVSGRSAGAIGLLIAAMVLLGLGAGAANQSVGDESRAMVGPIWVALGIGAACLSGLCYAVLSTGIRRVVSPAVPPAWVVFVTTLVGLVTMGPISVYRLGVPKLLDTRPDDLGFMLAAGVFNLVAYLALARGLQLTSLIRVNVINASQVAMCGVAGLLLFGEPPSWFLVLGVGMTIFGMTFIERSSEAAEL
jgi:drug/metabolite transporter, DME family